ASDSACGSLRAPVRKRSADRLPMPPAGLFPSQTFRVDSRTLSVGREWRPLQRAPQIFRLRAFVRQATLAGEKGLARNPALADSAALLRYADYTTKWLQAAGSRGSKGQCSLAVV